MSSLTSCYKSGTPIHWKGKLNLLSGNISAITSKTTKALVTVCTQCICSGGNAKKNGMMAFEFSNI